MARQARGVGAEIPVPTGQAHFVGLHSQYRYRIHERADLVEIDGEFLGGRLGVQSWLYERGIGIPKRLLGEVIAALMLINSTEAAAPEPDGDGGRPGGVLIPDPNDPSTLND